ncbi:hypothetical protein FRB97_004724 [Tulasnella sp. 331]|nr:hypothetical protein FRB97_004724 [Tulasnella sp. 331]
MVSTLDGDAKPPNLKPLPQLPDEFDATASGPPPLTVAAVNHLRGLLAEALQEEKLDIAWLLPLETAIHDLTKAVRKERWLTGAVKTCRSRLESIATAVESSDFRRPEQEKHAVENSEDGIENQIRRAVDAVINSPQAEDLADQALAHLHERISKSTPSSSEPNRCHLLVTLAPSKLIRAFPDLGVNFDLRPHREACIFVPGQFSLPLFDDKQTNGSTILAGFEEWKDLVADKKSASFWTGINIVGGKFNLSGVTAASEHISLAKVLRLGVFCALAIQLELCLQRDTGLKLIFPAPPVLRPPPVKIAKLPQPNDVATSPPPSGAGVKPKHSVKAASGIWGFLTRKTNEAIGRPLQSINIPQIDGSERGATERSGPSPTSTSFKPFPSPSPFSAYFPRRVSVDIPNDPKLSWSDNFVQGSPPRVESTSTTFFSMLVDRIKADNVILSTSPEVRFPPPSLLLQLAHREQATSGGELGSDKTSSRLSASQQVALRLTGDDRTGLSSILGWSGSGHVIGDASSVESMTMELIGTNAFLRHQTLTVLYAEHVPAHADPALKDLVKREGRGKEKEKEKSKEKASETENQTGREDEDAQAKASEGSKDASVAEESGSRVTASTSTAPSILTDAGSTSDPKASTTPGSETTSNTVTATKPCTSAHWRTYWHFSRNHDRSLGESIIKMCSSAERGDVCGKDGCGKLRKVHGMDWVHAAVKIVGTLDDAPKQMESEPVENGAKTTEPDIQMWSSCKVCNLETKRTVLGDGSFLPDLADATLRGSTADPKLPTPRKYPAPALPPTRFNILRHFQYGAIILNFTLSPIDSDIFEVKVPRIQITKGVEEVKKLEELGGVETEDSSLEESPEDEEKEDLRLEITDWWMGLKEYLGELEDVLAGETAKIRTKRLPSTPDSFDDEKNAEIHSSDHLATPRPSEISSTPNLSVPPTESLSMLFSSTPPASSLSLRSTATTPQNDYTHPESSPSLEGLRQAFQACELGLYRKLSETSGDNLNSVRCQFHASAILAKRRIMAWRSKHVTHAITTAGLGDFDLDELDPAWFDKTSHAIPGSRVIVRERDWGSIIAFTLSSTDYKRELAAIASEAATSASNASMTEDARTLSLLSTPSTLSLATQASMSTSKLPIQTSRKVSAASATTTASSATKDKVLSTDDDDWDIWPTSEEQYTTTITRKENPKDATGILGLRDVLRQQRTVEASPNASGLTAVNGVDPEVTPSGSLSSRFSSLGNSASMLVRLGIAPLAVAASATDSERTNTPAMAWAKAETRLATQPAQGQFKVGGSDIGGGSGLGESLLLALLDEAERRQGSIRDEDGGKDPLGVHLVTNTPTTSKESPPIGHSTIKVSPSKFARAPSVVEETSEGGQSLAASMSVITPSNSLIVSDLPLPNVPALSASESTPSLTHSRQGTDETIAPPVPPKDECFPPSPSTHVAPLASGESAEHRRDSAATQGSISTTFASAFRYVLGVPISAPPLKHHGLLSLKHRGSNPLTTTLYPPIDQKPHLKYEVTFEKRLKFSCTVYYARQFGFLRRRCGVDAGGSGSGSGHTPFDYGMIKSLERCVGWSAEGGKSKSRFETHFINVLSEDDRYIIKTLVNAWNVADLQVLLDLSPSYFRYMDSTANQASVLAKLMGFYTIEMQTFDSKGGSGPTKIKVDLLVMENLFCNFKIAPGRTFDLKGIAGRKVKSAANAIPASASTNKVKDSIVDEKDKEREGHGRRRTRAVLAKPAATAVQKPLFDGEWIEGQQKAMVLVQPHSKAILKEAIRNDAEFLARSNIMDYSLLLGIDQERRQIACGLVDTIGSYTFAKTLEYKAKQGLTGNSGREVTVVPPAEYQERFVNAMEGYFFACPDKWSKPASTPGGDSPEPISVDDVPSIF